MILSEGMNEVKKERFAEKEVMEDLDTDSSHTEELDQPSMKGRSPLERLRGSEDFMVDQDQPLGGG